MRVQEPCVELLPALLLHEDPWPSFESIPALNKNQRLSAAPPANYRRLTQREQLQALRQEVSALAQYFQQLSENQELQRSLDRLLNESTVSLINWRRAATRQRHARAKAEETKAELMRRIAVNVSFLENVKQLLMIQAHRIAERPSLCMPMRVMPIGLDNKDIQMFQALQSGLDYRCNRLDAILQQCVSRFGTTQKTHELFIHPNGRSVEVRQIDIQPFDAATISNTMQQYVEKQANVYWRKDNDVYVQRAVNLGEFCSDGRPLNVLHRSVMRHFDHQDQTIVLWESMIKYDADQTRGLEAITLRHQGCIVLRSFEDLGGSLSQKRILIQLVAPEGSVLSPHVTAVLEPLRCFGRRQVQNIENLIMDAAMKSS